MVSVTMKTPKEQRELQVRILSKTRKFIDENFGLQAKTVITLRGKYFTVMCQKTIASLVGEWREGRLVFGWIYGTTIQTFLIPDAGRRKSTCYKSSNKPTRK